MSGASGASDEPPVRDHVVDALFDATRPDRDYGDDHIAELMFNATPAERAAVAERHRHLAELTAYQAVMLRNALTLLGPHWRHAQSLGAVLKTAPPDVAAEAIEWLRRGELLPDEPYQHDRDDN